MNEKWINRKINVVFPVKMEQDDANSIVIRDARGIVVCEFIELLGDITPQQLNRMRWIKEVMNGSSKLGIGRVKDFEKAGRACESEWERWRE